MNEVKSVGESGVVQLSETKRHLLEKFLTGQPRENLSGTVVLSPENSQQRAPTGKARSFPRMRHLTLDDYPQVSALESKYGLGLKSYEHWSHIWINNPVYHERRRNWPLGWVLETDNNQIVGAHGNIPLLYELNGRRIIAAQGRGLVLDSRYRGYSLWLLGAFLEQKNAELYLDTSASLEADRADRELGAVQVPVGSWDRDVFWITDYRCFLSGWLRRKLPQRLAPIAGTLCYPLAAGLYLKDRVTKRAPQNECKGFSIARCNGFDDRFDEFWDQLRNENSHVLLAVRTRKILEWHFAYAVQQDRLWIWTVTQDSRLVAYSIFLKIEDPGVGIVRIRLIDFQALKGNAALLQLMLSAALEQCRLDGIHVLENSGLAFGRSGINELAPHQRKRSWWIYLYKARDRELQEKLSNPDVWNPSLYDGDASIL